MKIAVICPDFKRSNINKLPWKYIYKISCYLNINHDIFIITDSEDGFDEIRTITINNLFVHFKGESSEVLDVLDKENPDKCIMLLGVTSFLRSEFQINIPVYGVFTSPPYNVWELIKNVGLRDSLKYHNYMVIHYLNALIPNFLIKKWSQKFEKIIFLSEYTKQRIVRRGASSDKCVIIPIGIEKHFDEAPNIQAVEKLRNIINPNNYPVIMYFTSPLTLRGTDTLIKAFAKLGLERECKLIFLSRIDYDELRREEKYLIELAKSKNVFDSVEIISEYLNPQEIKNYLSFANIICLPFKLVISDVPVSILEAISAGKPVISTNVACIPELVEDSGLIVPANNEIELAEALRNLLNDEELVKDFVSNGNRVINTHYKWEKIGDLIESTIR